jgi:hypothetical protein
VAFVKAWWLPWGFDEWSARSGAASPDRQLAFMKQILPWFDTMEHVAPRYAWFAATSNNAQIGANDVLIQDGGLTPLGRHYNTTT